MGKLPFACTCLAVIAFGCAPKGTGRPATLTGCLEQDATANTYVLNMPAVGEQPTATSGPAEPGWVASRTYRLDAVGDVDFSKNVGARVTMSGRLEDASRANAFRENPIARAEIDRNTTTAGTSGHSTGADTRAIFHVSSLRKVADTCTGR